MVRRKPTLLGAVPSSATFGTAEKMFYARIEPSDL